MSISISDYQLQLEEEIKYLQNEIDKINSQIDKINQEAEFGKTQIDKEFEQIEPENTDFWLIIEQDEQLRESLEILTTKEILLESSLKFLNLD